MQHVCEEHLHVQPTGRRLSVPSCLEGMRLDMPSVLLHASMVVHLVTEPSLQWQVTAPMSNNGAHAVTSIPHALGFSMQHTQN